MRSNMTVSTISPPTPAEKFLKPPLYLIHVFLIYSNNYFSIWINDFPIVFLLKSPSDFSDSPVHIEIIVLSLMELNLCTLLFFFYFFCFSNFPSNVTLYSSVVRTVVFIELSFFHHIQNLIVHP